MEIQCGASGLWNNLPDKHYAKHSKIRINSVDRLDSSSEKINAFVGKLHPLKIQKILLKQIAALFQQRLFGSDVSSG